jgi:hypothetical protein
MMLQQSSSIMYGTPSTRPGGSTSRSTKPASVHPLPSDRSEVRERIRLGKYHRRFFIRYIPFNKALYISIHYVYQPDQIKSQDQRSSNGLEPLLTLKTIFATIHSTSSGSTSTPWSDSAVWKVDIGILDDLSLAIHLQVSERSEHAGLATWNLQRKG